MSGLISEWQRAKTPEGSDSREHQCWAYFSVKTTPTLVSDIFFFYKLCDYIREGHWLVCPHHFPCSDCTGSRRTSGYLGSLLWSSRCWQNSPPFLLWVHQPWWNRLPECCWNCHKVLQNGEWSVTGLVYNITVCSNNKQMLDFHVYFNA